MSTGPGSSSHWICRPSNSARISDATFSGSRAGVDAAVARGVGEATADDAPAVVGAVSS
jgi:hypothetical protein